MNLDFGNLVFRCLQYVHPKAVMTLVLAKEQIDNFVRQGKEGGGISFGFPKSKDTIQDPKPLRGHSNPRKRPQKHFLKSREARP